MSKNEWLGAAAIVAVCLLVFGVVWFTDPTHRTAPPRPVAAQRTPAPAMPAMLINNPLTRQPGQEVQADWNPAVVACWGKEGEPVRIIRRRTLAGGTRYLLVRAAACEGWVQDFFVTGH